MPQPFIVIETRGPAWNDERIMDEQNYWPGHAAYMEALVTEHVIVLGGPLEGTRDVVLVIQAESCAEIRERLAHDPWIQHGLLLVKDCQPWRIRLGALP